MYDLAVFWHWAEFAVRWVHVITAMAWIGSSFYFIALDLGLNRDIDGPADGEEWQVHGGGFYHVQKYLVAPDQMPAHLTWFKWESYSTWLSGAALLMIVYWAGAELYLIDYTKIELTTFQAILISGASLVIGWICYDLLCKSKLGDSPTTLMVILFGILVVMAWGYNQVFTGRAALLHLGAFTATIMTANVFVIIMPNQRIVVADLKAGRTPDAKYGKIAKLRSTHNNYLTLPVIFLMLSNHYPLAFASEYNWVIAALVFLLGVLIRHYFNSLHARNGRPHWTWGVSAVIFVLIMWLSVTSTFPDRSEAAVPTQLSHVVDDPHFASAKDVVIGRCSMCHGAEPVWGNLMIPPKGVVLDNDADIALQARNIYLQAGISRAMPPGNITEISDEDREILVAWYRSISQ